MKQKEKKRKEELRSIYPATIFCLAPPSHPMQWNPKRTEEWEVNGQVSVHLSPSDSAHKQE
jgi:hypothetical protein